MMPPIQIYMGLLCELDHRRMNYTLEVENFGDVTFRTIRFKCPNPESCKIGHEDHVAVFKKRGKENLEVDTDLSNCFMEL